MTATIYKKTGEFEAITEEITNADGEKETVERRQEILEEVQSVEVPEEHKALVLKNVQLRAMLLKRDTGYGYVIKTV